MITALLIVASIVGVGWFIWGRRGVWGTRTAPLTSEGIPVETLAFEAFTHGNTCLAEGKFAEAIASFHRSRELDPKRLHVAQRLAEAERQQAVSTTPSATAS